MKKNIIRELIMLLLVVTTKSTKWFHELWSRLLYTEIGFTGNVSLIDNDIAKQNGLRPLNRPVRWLFNPLIIIEKTRRQMIWRKHTENL